MAKIVTDDGFMLDLSSGKVTHSEVLTQEDCQREMDELMAELVGKLPVISVV